MDTAYLRCCSRCNAFLATADNANTDTYCKRCKPKCITPFAQWAAALKPGDRVYVQPYATRRGLSRSQYVVVDREGDQLTVQPIGMPEFRMTVHVNHCGQHDLTPLPLGTFVY
jgi:hypothetical protein